MDMKSECEIRVMLANLEAELKNMKRNLIDLGVSPEWSPEVKCLAGKIEVLEEILETKENNCY